jgi:outer membrane protein
VPTSFRNFLGLAVFAAASLAAGAATAQAADFRVGFVNTERLFREAAPAKRAQQKLEREFANRDAELQKLSKQVQGLQSSLEKDGVTGRDRRRNERDLANLTRDLQRAQREFREDLNLPTRNWPASGARQQGHQQIPRPRVRPHRPGSVVYASQHRHHRKVIKALADK